MEYIMTTQFRYELLNAGEALLGEIDCERAEISYDEGRAIMRTAVFHISAAHRGEIDFLSDRIRPWLVVTEGGERREFPLGIFLPKSPENIYRAGDRSLVAEAYDKLLILDEDRFVSRFAVAKEMPYISVIERILTTSGVLGHAISPTDMAVPEDIEFPAGMKKREAVNDLLRRMNYVPLHVDEHGVFGSFSFVNPADRRVDLSYSTVWPTSSRGIILPEFSEKFNYAGDYAANVFICVGMDTEGGEIVATYENENPLSPLSTVRRGRRIVDFQKVSGMHTRESLELYARRLAAERSIATGKLTFKTPLVPGHGCFKTLHLTIPELSDTPGKFAETAWHMDLRPGGQMTHEAGRAIRL